MRRHPFSSAIEDLVTINGHRFQALPEMCILLVDGVQCTIFSPQQYRLVTLVLATGLEKPLYTDYVLDTLSIQKRALRELMTAVRKPLNLLGLDIGSIQNHGYVLCIKGPRRNTSLTV